MLYCIQLVIMPFTSSDTWQDYEYRSVSKLPKDRQCAYNITLRGVRAIIIAVENK